MGFINNYQYESYTFDVADGEYSVLIQKAEVVTSKTGKQMIEVTMRVGDRGLLYTERYVEGDYFNQNISKFFDAFQIQHGNFNFSAWVGAKGRATFAHKEESYTDGQTGELKTVNKCYLRNLIVTDTAAQEENNATPLSKSDARGMESAFNGQTQKPQGNSALTQAQSDRLNALVEATYPSGQKVFSDAEIMQYHGMLPQIGGDMLISEIERYLSNRYAQSPLLKKNYPVF